MPELPLNIFISSSQKEFAAERTALKEFLRGDPIMRRFFECFLFEDRPAADRRADQCYLDEIDRSDIYIGLFGNDYGWEDVEGFSPTHREFNRATEKGKIRLIYVKGTDDHVRHPKMRALVSDAASNLIRRRFNSAEELVAAVYASLVRILEEEELIRFGPFDATFCRNATLEDLDEERITRFLGLARRGRNFPLTEGTTPHDVLIHLNLLDKGRPTNAAILLFGKNPQRFLITSEVKCAHFHGYEVQKPIPSYQVYKGTVFDLVDQAKDFVLSKIDLWVGTRDEGTQVPTKYEIPQVVVAEAIVNAVVHRDYTSKASVQIMLFKNRLEVWNPGTLPPTLTLEALRGPHPSLPHNPLIAEPMYLTKYIERMGTGIRDMILRCKMAGLPEPEIRIDGGFWVVTIQRKSSKPEAQSAPGWHQVGTRLAPSRHQVGILRKCLMISTIGDLMAIAERTDRTKFRNQVLNPLLNEGFLEMTIPDKPTSSKQRYRTTEQGRIVLAELDKQENRS